MCNTCNSSVYTRCSNGCGWQNGFGNTYNFQRICRDCCGNIRVAEGCGCHNGDYHNVCAQWLWNLLFGNTYCNCRCNRCGYTAQTTNSNGFGCGYTAQTASTNGFGCGYTAQTANTNVFGCGYTARSTNTGCGCGCNG